MICAAAVTGNQLMYLPSPLLLMLIAWSLTPETDAQIDPNNPVVTTNYGRIRGSTIDIGDGKSVYAFIGIPYAASPTRGNRFRVSS